MPIIYCVHIDKGVRMTDWIEDDREQEYQWRQEREQHEYEAEERAIEEWKEWK